MKFGFVTCVRLGLACMEEIYAVGGKLDLVITLPDDIRRAKSGRVFLDDFCRREEILLLKTPNVNREEAIAAVRERQIDWLFIIGWSQIAREGMLAAPLRGAIGMHPALLPRGRGRASIPWAILKGLEKTGVTMFKLDPGVDTGPIMAQWEIPVEEGEIATTLYEKTVQAHRSLIASTWEALAADLIELQVQDESQASYWPGRKPEDGRIDPRSMSALEVDRLVRAVTHPYPGAFVDAEGARWRIWAGRPHPGKQLAQGQEGAHGGKLWLVVEDGAYQADDWEREGLAGE